MSKINTNFRKFIKDVLELMRKPVMSVLPGQLSFFLLLSLIPMMLIIGLVAPLLSVPLESIVDLINSGFPADTSSLIIPLLEEKTLNYKAFTENDYKTIGESFSKSAREHGLIVHTCFEDRNLTEYGFSKDECLSHTLAYKLTGKIYKEEWTARKMRKCHCVKMVDIGVYNSCKHFCKYCYANFDEKKVNENYKMHNPNSSLLIGELKETDIIKERIK